MAVSSFAARVFFFSFLFHSASTLTRAFLLNLQYHAKAPVHLEQIMQLTLCARNSALSTGSSE